MEISYIKLGVYLRVFIGLVSILQKPICHGLTDPRDVFALNSLYAALEFPLLPGWLPIGGDPCAESWQGVLCVNSNVTGIVLTGANLGGELGVSLGSFASIIQIDLSSNHIGGSIPSDLPITIRTFSLSGNQFSGNIPDTLSTLGQLSELSFSNNLLTGEIPDAFQQLMGLINLDLSGNNLSGQLPPSVENLSSLTTLHLQNNHLIGTLDVLQNLPLRDLNIENNLFSGPVPDKLLSIPNFKRSGNPFNTTILPSPPASPPLPYSSNAPSEAPSPELTPVIETNGSSPLEISNSSKGGEKLLTPKRVIWIGIAGFFVVIALALGLWLVMSRCCKRRQTDNEIAMRYQMNDRHEPKQNLKQNQSSFRLYDQKEKGHGRVDSSLKQITRQDVDFNRVAATSKRMDEHKIDMTVTDVDIPLPQPLLLSKKVIVNPIIPRVTTRKHSTKSLSAVRSFTIASLQQYTNSFSQENLIGGGMLGTVYKAELPSGKLLAVKKLDAAALRQQSEEDFLELVSSISKLRHVNIVELEGYCSEHGQRLLVSEYCNNGTLYEALHLDDEIHNRLSWNNRIRLALGAARALEYLHEVCQPSIVHRNFKSANVLLDDKLAVHVSDCGSAPLISPSSASLLQGNGYNAPELELGSYTCQSDVYSFGVVMLEILTGRKSYDRSRPRGEHFLVRWAIPQLHDIDALSRMVDPSLNGAYPSKSLSRFADIISLCVQAEPEFRPPMSEIVRNLLQMIQTTEKSPSRR